MAPEQKLKKRKAVGDDEVARVKKVKKAISEPVHKATDGPVFIVPKKLKAPEPEKVEVPKVTATEGSVPEQPSVQKKTEGISKKYKSSHDAVTGTEEAISIKPKQGKATKEYAAEESSVKDIPKAFSKKSKSSNDAVTVEKKGSEMKSTEEVTSKKTKKVKATKEASPAEVPADNNVKVTSKIPKSSKEVFTVEKSTYVMKRTKEVKSSDRKKVEASKSVECIPFDDNDGSDDSENDEDDEDIDDQTEALLKGFESDDEAVTDADVDYKLGEPIPEISKKAKKKAAAAVEKSTSDTPGIVYLGRIPHGFYEHEMRQYFGQFGDILRLRLSRNRRTASSKHFAFVEFKSAEVAEIVVKTMDNYLLFGHILKCKLVAPEQVHRSLWKGANKRFKKVPWNKIEGRKLGQGMTEDGWDRRIKREERRRGKKGEKMAELGYEFEVPKLKSAKDVSKKQKALTN